MTYDLTLHGNTFNKVCFLDPEIDENGMIVEYRPQSRYKNTSGLPLNKEGGGTFCRFTIPKKWSGKEGVYAILVNGLPRYVGECDDLERRYNMGYGIISPRKCFKGGQSTNCRINKKILKEVKKDNEVELYFTETANRFEVEHELIMKVKPEWNRTVGKPSMIGKVKKEKKQKVARKSKTYKSGPSGKYHLLEEYLSGLEKDKVKLAFPRLESILGFPLPGSASKHGAWWSNGGHKHANSWLNVGWRVVEIKLGEFVVFERVR